MFNVMVTSSANAWEEGVYTWSISRILEHTDPKIAKSLESLDNEALETLVKLPTLFMYEQYVEGAARVGTIKKIQRSGSECRIILEFDDSIPPLGDDQLSSLKWELQLADFEFSRTHWAVKNGDLYTILRDAGHLPSIKSNVLQELTEPSVNVVSNKVFLVHGRDEAVKHSVARFLEKRVGLDVVILSERPNLGRSILTKFQIESADANFAVILMTGDDLGNLRPELGGGNTQPISRPRQNVIFEMGFFIGKLGVDRVCALVPPGVDRPSDYDGIVYVPFDDQDGWQRKLVTELHAAQMPVSPTWWQT